MERMGRPKERCSFLRVRVALIVIKSACKKTNKIKSTWEKACFALSYNPHSHIQALKRRGEMCSCCAMYSLLYMAHNQTQVRRLEMIETLPSQSPVVFLFFCFHSLHWCFTDDNGPRVVDAFQFLLSHHHRHRHRHTKKKKETLKATILNSTKVLPLLRYAVTQAPALTNQASIFFPFFLKATESIRTGKGLIKETEQQADTTP